MSDLKSPDLQRAGEEAQLLGRLMLFGLVPVIYGAYKFFSFGFGADHYLVTYVPVFGAVTSLVAVMAYFGSMHASGPSLAMATAAFSGFIPYAFSLYLVGYLGLFSFWSLLTEFSFGQLIFGIFWMLIGYGFLHAFWQLTELAKRAD